MPRNCTQYYGNNFLVLSCLEMAKIKPREILSRKNREISTNKVLNSRESHIHILRKSLGSFECLVLVYELLFINRAIHASTPRTIPSVFSAPLRRTTWTEKPLHLFRLFWPSTERYNNTLYYNFYYKQKLEQSWTTVYKEYCQNGGQKKPAEKKTH